MLTYAYSCIHGYVAMYTTVRISPPKLLYMDIMQVADSRGHTLFQKDDVSAGKFAFTTEDYDMFEACFHSTVVGEYTILVCWQSLKHVAILESYTCTTSNSY